MSDDRKLAQVSQDGLNERTSEGMLASLERIAERLGYSGDDLKRLDLSEPGEAIVLATLRGDQLHTEQLPQEKKITVDDVRDDALVAKAETLYKEGVNAPSREEAIVYFDKIINIFNRPDLCGHRMLMNALLGKAWAYISIGDLDSALNMRQEIQAQILKSPRIVARVLNDRISDLNSFLVEKSLRAITEDNYTNFLEIKSDHRPKSSKYILRLKRIQIWESLFIASPTLAALVITFFISRQFLYAWLPIYVLVGVPVGFVIVSLRRQSH